MDSVNSQWVVINSYEKEDTGVFFYCVGGGAGGTYGTRLEYVPQHGPMESYDVGGAGGGSGAFGLFYLNAKMLYQKYYTAGESTLPHIEIFSGSGGNKGTSKAEAASAGNGGNTTIIVYWTEGGVLQSYTLVKIGGGQAGMNGHSNYSQSDGGQGGTFYDYRNSIDKNYLYILCNYNGCQGGTGRGWETSSSGSSIGGYDGGDYTSSTDYVEFDGNYPSDFFQSSDYYCPLHNNWTRKVSGVEHYYETGYGV